MSYYRQGPPRSGQSVQIGVPPLTPVVRVIMIVCAVVWLAQFLERMLFGANVLAPALGVSRDALTSLYLWQPLTYMWLHGDLFHIGFNMLLLWMIGGELERHWGSRAFLRYYLVCGIGAGLFMLTGTIPTIGASGAVYGLLLAFGMLFGERVMLFMLIFPMKARTVAIILFAVAFLSSLEPSRGVAHLAHLGGMVVGWLYLKRAWRIGDFYREMKWRLLRRKFKVVSRPDDDRWIH